MSSGGNGGKQTKKVTSSSSKKAVSFAPPPPPTKRKRSDSDDDSAPDADDQYHQVASARRERRLHKNDDDDDDDAVESTIIDTQTSLQAEEGVEIEPFHMKHEETDGSGYFEGDTYVFRSNIDDGGEADAWLDGIDSVQPVQHRRQPKPTAAATSHRNLDGWSTEELVQTILPHLSSSSTSSTETILQAISRYSHLSKSASTDRAKNLANDAFLDLTEAASALMLQGKTNIYQQTRQALVQSTQPTVAVAAAAAPAPVAKAAAARRTEGGTKVPEVLWEYKGQHDGAIHGPYTSQQMFDWTRSGYFVGASAVPIRKRQPAAATATSNDLLSDLMDDDDDDNENGNKEDDTTSTNDWQMSDTVAFDQYM